MSVLRGLDRVATVGAAAVAVDERGRVERLDLVGHRADVELVPALVERHPRDDRRVGAVLDDDRRQLAAELGPAERRRWPAGGDRQVRHVLPDEDAEPVGPVVPAVGLGLHVLADHVVAEPLGRGDVKPQRGVGRGGVQAVGPVALVERAGLEHEPAVQQDPGDSVDAADRDRAHPEVAADRVEHRRAPLPPVPVTVPSVSRRPYRNGLDGDHSRGWAIRSSSALPSRPVAVATRCVPAYAWALSTSPARDGPLAAIVSRPRVRSGVSWRPEMCCGGDGLEPHGLPDPARGGVEDPGRDPRHLLADRLVGGADRVDVADLELVRAVRAQQAGDVERERGVVPAVGAGQAVVDVHPGAPADSPEVEQHAPAAPPARDREEPAVPAARVAALDSRQRRLDRERHEDRLGQALSERWRAAGRPPPRTATGR